MALWLAVVAAAAVAMVALGSAGAAAEFDPLAREHAGIIAQLFGERLDSADAADDRPGDGVSAWEQERVTNADTAHFAGGFDGGFGPAAMTEVSAGARQQSAAEILAQTQAQIDAANHLRGRSRAGAGAGVGARAGTRTRAGHRMRHRMRFGQKHVARHWVADRLKAEARAQMRANAATGWPEFEGGDNEGKSQSEAVAEVVEAASNAGMTVDDIPLLPDSWIGWFAYTAPDQKRKIRGRLTYDFNLRKMQVDYFPGGLARETYFFDYQKQVRLLYKMIGSVDPTRRSYKKALKRQQDRRKAEEEAAERGEELPPLAAGSNAMHQEDMLVLDNEDYTWKECTSWDLVEPYQSMCPTNCFSLVQDPSVASIPNNPVSDSEDGGTLDPYQQEGEKVAYLFLTGHIPAVKEGEDDDESGAKAFVHPPLHLRYSAMRNNTPTEIQIGKSQWRFFRWTDLSEWDNFDLKDSGVIEALAKPDLDCIYAGSFDKDVEEMIQPKIPIILVKPPGAEDDEED